MDKLNNPKDDPMASDAKQPKTIFDLVEPDGAETKTKGMTLEEALAQVDAHSTGDAESDEKLKTMYRIAYKTDPLEQWELDFMDQVEREAEEERLRLLGDTAQ